MTDALWNWLETGEGVLFNFRRSASETFKEVAKDMIRNLLLNTVFDQLQDKLKKATMVFSATGNVGAYLGEVLSATDEFLDKAETQMPALEEATRMIADAFAARGFDLTGSSEGSATYNAAKSFSQEQGDILNGRLTAIQIAVRENNVISQHIAASLVSLESLTAVGTDVSEIRNMMIYTNSYLETVATYARRTYEDFGERLDRIILHTDTL